MSVYQMNELVLLLPEELKDKSLNIFSLTDDGPSEFSLVVSRDTLLTGDTVEGYVARQLALLAGKLPGVKVLGQSRVTVDGQAGVQTDLTITAPEGPMFQRQIALPVPGGSVAARPVVILTATGKEKLSRRWESAFHQAIESIRFRR